MIKKQNIFKIIGFAFFILVFSGSFACAATLVQDEDKIMGRVAEAESNRIKWLGKTNNTLTLTDPDLALIKDRLVYGQILGHGTLDENQESLVILAALTAIGAEDEITLQTEGALRVGTDPVAIKEAIYQCAPYVGFPKVEAAIARVNKVFKQNDIGMPLPGQGTVDENSRFEKGLATQKGIFGDRIQKMHDNALEGQKKIVVDYLTAYCFGDFYTRNGLDLKMRELVVFTAINALGGCESQAKSHARANIKVGNTKQNLVDALAIMLPFAGFPRTLNALAALNEACPEEIKATGKDAAAEDQGKKKK